MADPRQVKGTFVLLEFVDELVVDLGLAAGVDTVVLNSEGVIGTTEGVDRAPIWLRRQCLKWVG